MECLAKEDILMALQKAWRGSRNIKVTFKPGREGDVIFLWVMGKKGIVSLGENANLAADAVVASIMGDREFVRRDNYTVTVTLIDKTYESFFIDKLHSSFVKIEVVE